MSQNQIINDGFNREYIEQPKAKEIKTDKDVQTASLSEKLGYVLKRAAGQFLPEVGAKLLELASPQSLALIDRKSTRLNSSHSTLSRMPSSA